MQSLAASTTSLPATATTLRTAAGSSRQELIRILAEASAAPMSRILAGVVVAILVVLMRSIALGLIRKFSKTLIMG